MSKKESRNAEIRLWVAFIALCIVLLPSCTVSINLANSSGEVMDVIDSDPKTETTTDADLSIPASII